MEIATERCSACCRALTRAGAHSSHAELLLPPAQEATGSFLPVPDLDLPMSTEKGGTHAASLTESFENTKAVQMAYACD